MDITMLDVEGFVRTEYSKYLRNCVQASMHSWMYFCQLEDVEKRALSNGDRIKDYGYMRRNDSGPHSDAKELFHVSRADVPHLRKIAARRISKRGVDFLDNTDTLIAAIKPFIGEFALGVEAIYGLTGFTKSVLRSSNHWTFRYLHYFGGETLAHAHVDRGDFTLHLSETSPGAEYLGFDRAWRPLPVSQRETVIFPGMGLQLRSECKLKGLWHKVVQQKNDRHKERYALVAFIDFNQEQEYNQALGPLQAYIPGFNYKISSDNFKKLFVPRAA